MSDKKRSIEQISEVEEAASILDSLRSNVGTGSLSEVGAGAGENYSIDFIISAHGVTITKIDEKIKNIPENIRLFSTTDLRGASTILCCDIDQNQEGYLDRVCKSTLNQKSLFRYQYPNVIYNIQYFHEKKSFKSGVYNCEQNKFIDISSISKDWTLKNVLEFLSQLYPTKTINVYNLSCTLSDKCEFKRTKYTAVEHKEDKSISTVSGFAYDLIRKDLEIGKDSEYAKTEDLIPFFLQYYNTVIKTGAYNTNRQKVVTVCNTINKIILSSIFNREDDHPPKINGVYFDSIPITLPELDSIKYELIRTVGIMLRMIFTTVMKFKPTDYDTFILAEKIAGTSLQELESYRQTLTPIQGSTLDRLIYYLNLIRLTERIKDVHMSNYQLLVDTAKQKRFLIASIHSSTVAHSYKQQYGLYIKQLDESAKSLVEKAKEIEKLLKDPPIGEESDTIEALEDDLEDSILLLQRVRKQYEAIEKIRSTGGKRTYRRSVKKRTKTIRRKNK